MSSRIFEVEKKDIQGVLVLNLVEIFKDSVFYFHIIKNHLNKV